MIKYGNILKGLAIRTNSKNKFRVIELDYFADPAKDPDTLTGKIWKEKAMEGMPFDQWRQEYERDYGAQRGQLVFPEFSREVHVLKEERIQEAASEIVKEHYPKWCILDHAYATPTAVLWATINPLNELIFYDEYYVAGKTISEHAKALLEREQYHVDLFEWKNPEKTLRRIDRVAGVDLWETSAVGGYTLAQEYITASDGKLAFRQANRRINIGIERLRQFMHIEDGKTHFFIFPHMTNFMDEAEDYRREELSATQLVRKDPTDKPMKKKDHLMDDARYLANENPQWFDIRTVMLNTGVIEV